MVFWEPKCGCAVFKLLCVVCGCVEEIEVGVEVLVCEFVGGDAGE